MSLRHILLVLLLLCGLGLPDLAAAQMEDPAAERQETTRERDNDERWIDPVERDNLERIDPRLEADLRHCEGLESAAYERCVVDVRRRLGEI